MKQILLISFSIACLSLSGPALTFAQNSSRELPSRLPAKKNQSRKQPARTPSSASPRGAVDSRNSLRINYSLPQWNKSSTRLDTASIFMREGITGRIVQIQLTETEPDSSIFSGLYSINWENVERLKVEFYVPSQADVDKNGLDELIEKIKRKELRRSPFILRRSSENQSIEIFNSRDEARQALRSIRTGTQLQGPTQRLGSRKFPSDQEIDVARLAVGLKEREAAIRSQAERNRLGQEELKRLTQLRAAFKKLSANEKAARKAQAEQAARDAMALIQQEKLAEAKAKFEEAISLDPENRSYLFQYGVTLYRLGQFNPSIVYLDLASGPSVNPAERAYYMALNFFSLKEYGNSLAYFDKVIESKDPSMAPSALFYKGVIMYELKRWEEAKTVFQEVLDTSNDPRLDERAEAYMELILRAQQFEAEQARKWTLSATIGEMYDTNVLLSSDSSLDQGTASNSEGVRSLLLGSVKYRPMYEETKELSIQLDLLTMYTVDKTFAQVQSLSNTDPTMATLTVPWTHKGLLFGKGYKLDITPGYETIYMSVEDNETKEILNSYTLGFANLFVMSENWFATYGLDLRQDNSKLNSSVGDEDSSATKVKLSNSNLVFLTEDKSKILMADGGYTINQAKGRNAVYNRIDLSVGYLQPWVWDMSANLKLAYFFLEYPQNSNGRIDNSYTLSAGLSKKLSEIWSTGFLASYNINGSNVEANQYKKWTAMLTFSASKAF